MDIHLARGIVRYLVCDDALHRKVRILYRTFCDERSLESICHGLLRISRLHHRLDIQHRHGVPEPLVISRHKTAAFYLRLRRYSSLHKACVKADIAVIDKELVHPAAVVELTVLSCPDKIICVQILFSVYLFKFEEDLVVYAPAAHRR